MAMQRAPKQRSLTKCETINSYENWRQNLVYILSLDVNFAPFLVDGFTWQKKTADNQTRGLVDDVDPIPQNERKTATQKNVHLEMMLGQIANFCDVISRKAITDRSTSLPSIWQLIRQHFGFQSTGAHFLDYVSISLAPDERPEDLYQRLMSFFEDNLLTSTSHITHHGVAITRDEDLTPTLENTIVLLWLQKVHPGLPQLVKQKYGTDLRNKTLASLKPEISQALSSLLDELRAIEDTKVMRTATQSYSTRQPSARQPSKFRSSFKSCALCKTAGRPGASSHHLIDCKFLPEYDRRSIGRGRFISPDCDDADPAEDIEAIQHEPNPLIDEPSVCRVKVIQSPYLNTFYHEHPVVLTLDTGATTNMIKASFAQYIRLPIQPASQMARQADGITPLDVVGEVHCQLVRDHHTFQLEALVVKTLDVDVLAGNPFHVLNDIATRPAKRQVVIRGTDIVYYGSKPSTTPSVRRTQSYTLRSPTIQIVILPGDHIKLETPTNSPPDVVWALEPRFDCPTNSHTKPEKAWPTVQEVASVGHTVRVLNNTPDPIILKKNEHLCQVREVGAVELYDHTNLPANPNSASTPPEQVLPYSANVNLDPDSCLSDTERKKFVELHEQFDTVFNPNIAKYNGYSGNIQASVNMGPTLPPQRKGRIPHYNRDTLTCLQEKFDELEASGVFAKPEQVNVSVEYLNLSFLVKKPNGSHRLVTSFGEVGRYSKPQPSLMPQIDNVLRDIAKWNYIIVSDLLQSFYQIPLAHASMKFCGVSTPFKGIRVYTRCAMGMPGSETVLEELMSRVLGDLIQEGCVAKIADDLYCGGNTPHEALHNWSRVLQAMHNNNLRLSAKKTIICPKTTTILGWIWSAGTLRASSHRLLALKSASPPTTVHSLRSFIGAYKVLSRVLKGYASLLRPLENMVAGKPSRDKITWNDDLLHAFSTAKAALCQAQTITIPRPHDHLWIITDASVKQHGLAATMYSLRDGKLLLSGFFNAQLKKHQVTWLPCEVEALAIGTAVKHFAPYIVQSHQICQLLTDSRPCVQAYEKLHRGEFSTSSRVTTFLSVISRYNIHVRHISGAANLPSDYGSRHPIECIDQSCQICRFIGDLQASVVRDISVKDVIDGNIKMPFTSRTAWLATQQECPDLRRTHAHLTQGTRPSKKTTNVIDVKRYLRFASVSNDGTLVVRDNQPFHPTRERIVLPRSVVHGILTAIHLRFNHPTHHQLKLIVTRYFFALDLDHALRTVSSSCHHCSSLKSLPDHYSQPQSTSEPPDSIGTSFACDVMRRYKQCVLVLRETVSSFTLTALIESEQRIHLQEAILILCAEVGSLGDKPIRIRVDAAPGFTSLVNDPILRQQNIILEVGHVKYINKNPVAEHAIRELGMECLHLTPEGGPLSKITLALATSNLNSRIRLGGLSAHEVWTQRDQISGDQLPCDDRDLIMKQHLLRLSNHPSSFRSKSHGHDKHTSTQFAVGDLVFLHNDRDKTHARLKYMVVNVENNLCQLRKFTRNQFRSKLYDVRPSDCYPVVPTTLVNPSSDPIRGLDLHASDSDSHTDEIRQVPVLSDTPIPPAAIIQPPVIAPLSESEVSHVPDGTETPDAIHEPSPSTAIIDHPPIVDNLRLKPPGYSIRKRRPPSWHRSDDWDMS